MAIRVLKMGLKVVQNLASRSRYHLRQSNQNRDRLKKVTNNNCFYLHVYNYPIIVTYN